MNEDQSNLSAGRNAKSLNIILRSYLFFAAIVFSGTAVAKLLSDFSDEELKSYDPFLRFLTAGQLIVLVALLEIGLRFALGDVVVVAVCVLSDWVCLGAFGRRKLQMLGSRLAVGKDGRLYGGFSKYDSIGNNASDWRRFDVADSKESNCNPPEARQQ